MSPQEVSQLLSGLGRELWLLTAAAGDQRGGLIATFVSAASIVPQAPRVVVGVAKQHHTWKLLEAAGVFGLHLLGEQHLPWVWQFGLQSGRDLDKLAGLAITTAKTGAPLLTDALAWLDCRVEARFDTGDRTIYLAEVLAGQTISSDPVLTVRRMVELAPPERLRALKDGLAQDAVVDAEAIRAWRAAHQSDLG